ncbi:MAG: M20/M25/M40 family metallo-hydrolase [Armatimonadetes bacterium]|nr:M20/M25/M40 family metallo-hydrolase [Armatimonadota bacterium]
MDISRIAQAVDADAAVRRTQEMVRIPAVTGQEKPMAEYVAVEMRKIGLHVTVDAAHNAVGELRGSGGGRSLLLLTHTDSGPEGGMKDAYSGRLEDGAKYGTRGAVIYGRGACTPKSGIAAMMGAVEALLKTRTPLRGRLLVAAVTKDLAANHEGMKELHETAPLNTDIVVAGEPSNGQIVLGARGIAHYEVTFQGVPTHWGRPAEGVNPLYGLADLLLALESWELPSHPHLGKATVSPFEVRSDANPPRTPHECRLRLDRRVLPDESTDHIQEDLQTMVDRVAARRKGLRGSAALAKAMFPFSIPPDAPVVGMLEEAARAALGRKIGTTYISFGSNAAYAIKAWGAQGCALGAGDIRDVNETEHIAVEGLVEAMKVYAAMAALACA